MKTVTLIAWRYVEASVVGSIVATSVALLVYRDWEDWELVPAAFIGCAFAIPNILLGGYLTTSRLGTFAQYFVFLLSLLPFPGFQYLALTQSVDGAAWDVAEFFILCYLVCAASTFLFLRLRLR